jgi:thiamine pyrophosphate-dependent acetolactate synthase large subunit-like protein
MGDSAFGFSCMELDVNIRYDLPVLVIILNNNGIYSGTEELPENRQENPVTSLNPEARYEKIVEALGGVGFYVKTV